MSRNHITAYTDGSATTKNEKLGGFGVYVIEEDGTEHFYSEGWKNTKTGRMEVKGMIKCLQMITDKEALVHIYCDSEYVVKCVSDRRLWKWKRNLWMGIANPDLIIQYYEEYTKFKIGPKVCHIKGHTKNEDVHSLGNAIVDKLANFKNQTEYKQDLIE